jgi:hypothetical protein
VAKKKKRKRKKRKKKKHKRPQPHHAIYLTAYTKHMFREYKISFFLKHVGVGVGPGDPSSQGPTNISPIR